MQDAVTSHQNGDYERAGTAYQRLNDQYPGFADAWHFHGLLRHQLGESERALELLQGAQALAPRNVNFLLNFGRVLREQGDLSRSLNCLSQAHDLDPDHAQCLVMLVETLLKLDQGGEAVAEIERHLGWAGDNWQLWMLLGECREQGGDRRGALLAFAEAANLAPPGEVKPRLRRGEAALKTGDRDTARRDFERSLEIRPDSLGARLDLAMMASQAGDFETCEELCRQVLSEDPDIYSAWTVLATALGKRVDDAFARELDAAAERAGDDIAAWQVHFARGQVWERLGEYDRAFGAYRAANTARSAMRPYSEEAQVTYTRNLIEGLDGEFVARGSAIGVSAARPIFVCGMPRSGTTLVETILGSHPEVAPGGEMRFVHDRLRRRLGVPQLTKTGSLLAGMSDAELRALAEDWHHALEDASRGHARVTDKMPGNYCLLGLIDACFPNASIVYVRRDARDNCFSCYATPFAEGHAFAYGLSWIGHYYQLHEALVEHWRRVLGPDRIIEIVYEDLVNDPDGQVRRLLEHTGLSWEPRCLEFHREKRTVATASLYQVRQPMYSSSIGRWRRFERHLGPLLDALDGPRPL